MAERVTIVGGGLAGLTLGIGLRQGNVPVTVWETGRYPRHRVCGEFISGAGQGTLARLGCLEELKSAGAHSAKSAAFFAGHLRVATHPLPAAALSISRWTLDEWLALKFQRLGGELLSGTRWGDPFGIGIVRASGRRPVPVTDGRRLFGLKVHAQNVALDADLELHFVPAGYVGMCRLGNGDVNVCGLFRSASAVPDLALRWRDWLRGPPESALNTRLAAAQFDSDSFCSVAGLCLDPQRAGQRDECCVGDALTMIPPVTGNGMSMAFESAELAIEPLTQFSRGALTWAAAQAEIARLCDRRFAPRLRWAAWLQRALFQPQARVLLLFLAARSQSFRRGIFERTR